MSVQFPSGMIHRGTVKLNDKILVWNSDTSTDEWALVSDMPAVTGFEPANSNIQAHIANMSNPHATTAAQIGLGNVDNTHDSVKHVSYADSAGTVSSVAYATTAGSATYAATAGTAGSVTGGITGSQNGSGDNYLAKYSDHAVIIPSVIYESGGNIGIGTTTLPKKLNVSGSCGATQFFENGTALASLYLGISTQAYDSARLGSQLAAYYQPASTAITTSNINSQSVAYASTAGSATYATTAGAAGSVTNGVTSTTNDGSKDNYLTKYTDHAVISYSLVYDNGSGIGINTTSLNGRMLNVYGDIGCTTFYGAGTGLTGTASSLSVNYAATSGNSSQLNGQAASYYLAATAQAADSAKLGGQIPGYYASASSLAGYCLLSNFSNVDNTHDSAKSVNYATSAGSAGVMQTSHFLIEEYSGNLIIKYGSNTIVTIDSLGNVTANNFIL